MTPGPASAQIELLDSVRSGVGVVKSLWIENDAQFAEQFVERNASVSESRKLDAVPIHIPYRSLFAIDDQLA